MKMNESVLEEKSSLMALGLSLSSKLDWGSYIISIAFKKTGALIRSMKGLEWNIGSTSLFSREGLFVFLINCMIFLSPFLDVRRNVSFFSRTAEIWNSLSIAYFPLTYDLNGFNSGISRHLLYVRSF